MPRRRSDSGLVARATAAARWGFVAAFISCGGGNTNPALRVTLPPHAATWSDHTPWIIGHRGAGAAGARPENTFAAFDLAADARAFIETDIFTTRDGVLVLMHDRDTLRTTGVAGDILTMTASQVAELDASHAFHPEVFSPQRVPTFDGLLSGYAQRVALLPEIKAADPRAVAQAVFRQGIESQVVVQSFEPQDLLALRIANPAIKTALTSPRRVDLATLKSIGAWAIVTRGGEITLPYVAECHANGIRVIAYTVNDLYSAERLVEDDSVDGIITDDPAYLRAFWGKDTPAGSTVLAGDGFPGPGWARGGTVAALGVASGFATFPDLPAGGSTWIHAPVRTPEGSYRIATVVKLVAGSSDPSASIGVRFARGADRDEPLRAAGDERAYRFAHYSDGRVELLRETSEGRAVVGTGSWRPLSQGAEVPLLIDVTPASIRVTRTDGGETLTVEDAALSRRGWFSAYGHRHVAGLGPTTVTY